MGSRIAPQDMQAGLPPSFGPSSIGKASAQVVTRADCGLAQAYVPEKSAETSVARNDIQKPLYTGARRTEEGVAGASARQTHCPALQACKPQAQRFGADQKRRIDQSKTRVRGRQSGARALGRRSDRRVEEQLYSDPSGTPFAVCDAGQSRQQGHRKRHLWANQIGTEIATRTLQVPDMGSRQRAGRSPAPDHSDRYRRLLLRPTLPWQGSVRNSVSFL